MGDQTADPWQNASDEQLREFMALTPTQKFRLLVAALEILESLEPARRRPTGSIGTGPAALHLPSAEE